MDLASRVTLRHYLATTQAPRDYSEMAAILATAEDLVQELRNQLQILQLTADEDAEPEATGKPAKVKKD